jgi:hypothetical protein
MLLFRWFGLSLKEFKKNVSEKLWYMTQGLHMQPLRGE